MSPFQTKNLKLKDWFTDHLFIIPMILFVMLFMIYPVFYNVVIGFQDLNIYNYATTGGQWIGLENYTEIFGDRTFQKAAINSLIFTVVSIIFQFGIGFSLALLFNKSFRGVNFLRGVILLPWLTPMIVTGTLFVWLLNGDMGVFNELLVRLGIIDEKIPWLAREAYSLWGVVLANIWIGIPFNMILLLGGLQTLPKDVYEAASIDGAGRVRSLFNITLPLLKPTIMIVLVLGFIYTFRVFDLVFIMTSGGPANSSQLLPYYAYQLSFQQFEFGKGAAVSGIMFLVVFLIALFYLREVRKEESY